MESQQPDAHQVVLHLFTKQHLFLQSDMIALFHANVQEMKKYQNWLVKEAGPYKWKASEQKMELLQTQKARK